MRGPEDLIQVYVTLMSHISLDRERIIEDPRWATYADGKDLNDPEQLNQALRQYLESYIQQQQLFGGEIVFMPSTNGPSEMMLADLELIKAEEEAQDAGN